MFKRPLSVSTRVAQDASIVTVVAVRGLYPACEGTQTSGLGILETLAGSMRVLEKSGYRLEARLRKAIIKEGQVMDEMIRDPR